MKIQFGRNVYWFPWQPKLKTYILKRLYPYLHLKKQKIFNKKSILTKIRFSCIDWHLKRCYKYLKYSYISPVLVDCWQNTFQDDMNERLDLSLRDRLNIVSRSRNARNSNGIPKHLLKNTRNMCLSDLHIFQLITTTLVFPKNKHREVFTEPCASALRLS